MSRKPRFGRIFRRTWKKPDGTLGELPTWWVEYYRDGRQQRESSRSDRYADAERLLKRRQAEIGSGAPSPTFGTLRVAKLLDMLLVDYEVNGKSLDWAKYIDGHLRPVFGQMKTTSVGTDVVMQYVAKRRQEGIANSTINRELALLRRAFQLGFNSEPRLVATVPRIPRFKENNVRKGFFDYDQLVRLRAELPEHLRPVITFAYMTGCRKGEILSLQWTQVDLVAKVVRLEPGETKNDEARTIPFIAELFDMLVLQQQRRDLYYPDCPWVFFRYGKPVRNFYGAWKQASQRAGLVDDLSNPRLLFHDLRRTGVRNLIRAGVPERVAMLISGHKTRSVLDRYNIVDERDLVAAGTKLEAYIQAQSRISKAKSSTSDVNFGSAGSTEQGPSDPVKLLN